MKPATNFLLLVAAILAVDAVIVVVGGTLSGTSLVAYFQTWAPLILFFSLLLAIMGRINLRYWYERKQRLAAMAELQAEQKALRLLEYSIDRCTELVWWVDGRNLLCNVNQRLTEVLGYNRFDLIGQSPAVFEPQLDSGHFDRLRQADGASTLRYKTSLQAHDGSLRDYEVALNYFSWGGEEYICAFARDFTDRKEAEAELKAQRDLFSLFMQGLPAGAFVRKIGGEVLVANENLEGLTPKAFDRIEAEDREVWEHGPKYYEFDQTGPDGQPLHLEMLKFPLRLEGGEPMVGGLITDTTARRRSELELLENQAFLEATIAQSPVGIIILDAKTKFIRFFNPVAADLLGLSGQDELVGKTVAFDGLMWEVLTPERQSFPLEKNPLYKAFFQESSSRDRMIIRRPDGSERSVLLNSGPIYKKNGELLAAFAAFLDITELKEAQEQLESLNKKLEQMVDERTWELMRTNDSLRQAIDNLKRTQEQLIESEKFASLGSLVAGVAHEINTPVGVGVTAASYLKDTVDQINQLYSTQQMKKSDLEAFLANSAQSSQIILTNLERASHLIRSFKQISVDRSTDQKRAFKLREYCLEVFKSLHPPDKRLRLQVNVDGEADLELYSHPGAWSQILTNLYMNSCIHGFEGMTEGRIDLSFHRNGGGLVVKYRDNGKGMDEATLKKIYEPFFTTKRSHGGTGLGMNIVFNLVNQKLGGKIAASSEPGQGVEFTLEVPL